MQKRSNEERPKAHGPLRVEDPSDIYSSDGPKEGMFLFIKICFAI